MQQNKKSGNDRQNVKSTQKITQPQIKEKPLKMCANCLGHCNYKILTLSTINRKCKSYQKKYVKAKFLTFVFLICVLKFYIFSTTNEKTCKLVKKVLICTEQILWGDKININYSSEYLIKYRKSDTKHILAVNENS